ncbi:MAG: hypothetical protein H7Z41_08730 [Cytophagales bacterium]|nr:hypothetical protein [Armatimonadota bacterium]
MPDPKSTPAPVIEPVPLSPSLTTQGQQPWAALDAAQTGPPLPWAQSAGPVYTYEMKVAQGRVKGMVSDYRSGVVALTPEGVYLQGQAVLPQKTRLWIVLPLILLGVIIAAVVSSVLENYARNPKQDTLSWDQVQDIVLEPAKGRVCLVYRESVQPKTVFSLAFRPGSHYENFELAARYFAPKKVREGKIGPATSPWVYVVLVGVIVMIFALLYFVSENGGR